MLHVASGVSYACVSLQIVVQDSTDFLIAGLKMDSILLHKGALLLRKLVPADRPGVSEGNLLDLLVERVSILLLDRAQTATASRVCNYADVIEAGAHYVFVPDIDSVDVHGCAERYLFLRLRVSGHVGVHYEHGDAQVMTQVDKGKHRAQLQALVYADGSGPYASSHRSCSLNQDQCALALVLLRPALVQELGGHENVILRLVVELLRHVAVLGNPHFAESVITYHLPVLYVVDNEIAHLPILVLMLGEVELFIYVLRGSH